MSEILRKAFHDSGESLYRVAKDSGVPYASLRPSGADPENVRQLLGHKTLDMTMKIYTKIRNKTKRQALTKLSYGQGAVAPESIAEYPEMDRISVPFGHRMVTSQKMRQAN